VSDRHHLHLGQNETRNHHAGCMAHPPALALSGADLDTGTEEEEDTSHPKSNSVK